METILALSLLVGLVLYLLLDTNFLFNVILVFVALYLAERLGIINTRIFVGY